MAIKDSKSEQHIKDTAKQVFFKEGRMQATTQEIADTAGVNRTLLHYYFRSRDILLDLVFKESLTQLRSRVHGVVLSQEPFKLKIERIIDTFFEELNNFPYLETFIVLYMNKHPELYGELFTKLPENPEGMNTLLKEIQSEMQAGTIKEMEPVQFFINLFSLMSYPFIARPLYQNMFNLSNDDYKSILSKRKNVIMSLLFQ